MHLSLLLCVSQMHITFTFYSIQTLHNFKNMIYYHCHKNTITNKRRLTMLEILLPNGKKVSRDTISEQLINTIKEFPSHEKDMPMYSYVLLEDGIRMGELYFFDVDVDYCAEEGLPPHKTMFVRFYPSPIIYIYDQPIHWSFVTFCDSFCCCHTTAELKKKSIENF